MRASPTTRLLLSAALAAGIVAGPSLAIDHLLAGTVATAQAATATPVIKHQPASRTVAAGARTTFSVKATGSKVRYQWQTKAGHGRWRSPRAATHASWTLKTRSDLDGRQVRVVVKNAAGKTVSKAVKLSVVKKATITTQPRSVAVTTGAHAKFSVKASGTKLRYQWQTKADGGSWKDVSRATHSTYVRTTTAGDDGLRVRAVVGNAVSRTASTAATLMVTPATKRPTITAQPAAHIVTTVGSAAQFYVGATGSDLHFLWQTRMPGEKWTDAGTMPWLFVYPGDYSLDGLQARAIVSNAAGSVTTKTSELIVEQAIDDVTVSPDQVATIGDPVSITAKVGAGRHLRYEWSYQDESTGTWVAIASTDPTTPTLSFVATEETVNRLYRVNVSNYLGDTDSRTVLVYTYPFQDDGGTLSLGHGEPLRLMPTLIETRRPVSLQWEESEDGEVFTPLQGETSPNDVPDDAGETRSYRLVMTWSPGHEIASNAWIVTRSALEGE